MKRSVVVFEGSVMKSWVLVAVAVLVASGASAQTSDVKPPPVGQVTAQAISVVSGGTMTFERDVVWKFDGVALRADAEEKTEYKATSETSHRLPSGLRDSIAQLRYEPLGAAQGRPRQSSSHQSVADPLQSSRKFLGAVLGVVGGFLGGFFVCSHINLGPSGGEDPGLSAAILCGGGGAVLGGVLGYKLF